MEITDMPKGKLKLEDFTNPPSPQGSDLPKIHTRMSRLSMVMSAMEVTDPSYDILLDEFLALSDQYLLAKAKV